MSDQANTSHDAKPTAGSGPAGKAVQQVTDLIKRQEMPEKLLLIGSCATFLLGFFSWYTFTSVFSGMSLSGFSVAGPIFGITSVVTVALMVVPRLREAVLGNLTRKNTSLVFLCLAAVTFLFGPLSYLLSGGGGDVPNMPTGSNAGYSAGKTIWFWLAFMASGSAVFGAYQALRRDID